MQNSLEIFFMTPEGIDLYQRAIELHKKIEDDNAHMVHVNGIDMGYLDFGSQSATPLIWLHGSGSTGYELLNVQAGLVEAGYRVIAVDYRGHGKTQVEVTDYNTSLYHVADDISALMDHLQIERAVIGGLSKGGWGAAAFYDAYPDRVLGLLLEDGGSFSEFRLADDVQLNVVSPGPRPYPAEALKKIYDTSTRYESLLEGVKALCSAYLPALSSSLRENIPVEYITVLMALLRQDNEGKWFQCCEVTRLMTSDSAGRPVEAPTSSVTLYSRLPMMQRSQELTDPLVIFRNLHVPMHIIDPDSPTDWLPVRHQNEELQKLHPDLIVHDVYDYEHSPHEAHLERPERFIKSAKALLHRVKLHEVAE